jgi:GntR family transcriptional regulator, transcriptional repressor for pyruvate dehydrogenase complex
LSDSLTTKGPPPAAGATLGAIERTTVAHSVFARLHELIEGGGVGVGQKLPSEAELARTLGVSRPAVREALGGLRAMGLVESIAGRGTFVTASVPPSGGPALLGRYSTDELHEVRSHLEIPGARLAARRHGPEQIARLRSIVERSRGLDDPIEWVRLDVAFHVELAAMTGNRVQVLLVETLRQLLTEQSVAVARAEGRLAAATEEHQAILDAIAAEDGPKAEGAMAAHLAKIRELSHRTGTGPATVRREPAPLPRRRT